MKIFLIATCILLELFLSGCGDKFEECIQKQQEDYRQLHPEASYSQVSRLRGSYEAMCSTFKK